MDGKGKRRRTKRFEVDAAVYGKGTIVTCGSTPEQLLTLRQAMRGPEKRAERLVRDYLNEIGYPELSYLRSEEAADLLNQINELQASQQPPPPEPPQAAADSELASGEAAETDPPYETDKVLCKKDGEMVNRDWCSTYCDIRKRDGYCLYLGEEPPEAGGLI